MALPTAFVFTTALGGGNLGVLLDFASGTDEIELDDAIFGALPTGALDAGAFVLGTAAQDADDRIIYDQATGSLFYDADGNGAGGAIQFALIDDNSAVAASDFLIV
jgi:Ca2+-binding RTX toxin-like protein